MPPARSSIAVSVAGCLAEIDRLEEAERWLRRAVQLDPGNKEAQANLGSILVRLDRLLEAEAPCLAALAIDENLISPRQNLSVILAERDPVTARNHRDRAYLSKQVFLNEAVTEQRRILILTAADAANVPLQHLLKRERYTVIRWYVEYATPQQATTLPSYDLVFNSIGDPDFIPVLPAEATKFIEDLGNHLLNRFDCVERTARQALPALLGAIPNTRIPAVLRCEHAGVELARIIGTSAMALPVLMRPVGSHGGKGLVKIDHLDEFIDLTADGYFLTEFVDFRSQDGWYRKYRAIFVDGEAFPYHLAISLNWLVHYWTVWNGQRSRSKGRRGDVSFRSCEQHWC